MTFTEDMLQLAAIIFSAGIVWERLNALNRKVQTLNGKTAEALVDIAHLKSGRAENHEHIVELRREIKERAVREESKLDAILAKVGT